MYVIRIACQLASIIFLIFTGSFATENLPLTLKRDTSQMHNIVNTNTLREDYNESRLLESKTQESLLKITSPLAQNLSDEKIQKDVSGYTRKPLINLESNDFSKEDENLYESLRNKVPHLWIGIGKLDTSNDQKLDRPVESFNSFDWQRVFLKGQAEAIFSLKRALMNNNDGVTARNLLSESAGEINEFEKHIDDEIAMKRGKRSQDLNFLVQFLMKNRDKIGTARSIIIRNGRYEDTDEPPKDKGYYSIVNRNLTTESIQEDVNIKRTNYTVENARNYESGKDVNTSSRLLQMEKRLKRQACFCPSSDSPEDQFKAYLIQNMRLLPFNQGGQDIFTQIQQMYDELQAKALDEYNTKAAG
ncbi:hypothetical protein QAD02_022794 [Eretmocerus hayati]|uniref:Uncharacterized protein n=1 Tax=Eretmocerus hayati TaxID=131215 RepID=A0ACC2PYX3_9HYME|nr:hypothetical protein QAD02_022794 [Eretmocerus hayati]